MGKADCGNEKLAFLASVIKEGRTLRRRRLQMQLALNNRRRFLNLVCLLLRNIKGKEHHSSSSSSFLSSVS